MEFRILGPLEVLSDGRPLDLGGQKPRALLALLLLEANRVLPRDALIDALWDESPPETARKALQVHVCRRARPSAASASRPPTRATGCASSPGSSTSTASEAS